MLGLLACWCNGMQLLAEVVIRHFFLSRSSEWIRQFVLAEEFLEGSSVLIKSETSLWDIRALLEEQMGVWRRLLMDVRTALLVAYV